MCVPLVAAAALASTAVGAASSIYGYFGAQAAHHSAVEAANLNFNMKSQQVGQENSQLSENQSQQSLTDSVRYAQSLGQIANSASAMGLGASSTHQLLSARTAGYNNLIGTEDTNLENKRNALGGDLTGASIQRSVQIAQAPKENLFQLGMGLVGNAAQGASMYGSLGGRFGISPAATASQSSATGYTAALDDGG
jgi:hypothetical protein